MGCLFSRESRHNTQNMNPIREVMLPHKNKQEDSFTDKDNNNLQNLKLSHNQLIENHNTASYEQQLISNQTIQQEIVLAEITQKDQSTQKDHSQPKSNDVQEKNEIGKKTDIGEGSIENDSSQVVLIDHEAEIVQKLKFGLVDQKVNHAYNPENKQIQQEPNQQQIQEDNSEQQNNKEVDVKDIQLQDLQNQNNGVQALKIEKQEQNNIMYESIQMDQSESIIQSTSMSQSVYSNQFDKDGLFQTINLAKNESRQSQSDERRDSNYLLSNVRYKTSDQLDPDQIKQIKDLCHTVDVIRQKKDSLKSGQKIAGSKVIKSMRETSMVYNRGDEKNKMINQFKLLDTLGKGGFGKVKMAERNLFDKSEYFAIKILKKNFLKKQRQLVRDASGKAQYVNALMDVMKEIAVMKKLSHQNIVRLHEVINDEEGDKIYMVLDLVINGQLIEWDSDASEFYFCKQRDEKFLSEDDLRKIFRDCIKGLSYLHHHGIIHRDLKPQNILFDEHNNAKIADFGVSSIAENLKDDILRDTKGTYLFMSPESLSLKAGKEGFSGKLADIWALGVTFYAFIYRNIPFKGDNLDEIIESINQTELDLSQNEYQVSEGLQKLLLQLLEKDPKKRASLEDISKNEWLNEGQTCLFDEMNFGSQYELNSDDINNAVIPLSTMITLKKVTKKFKMSIKNGNLLNRSQFIQQIQSLPSNQEEKDEDDSDCESMQTSQQEQQEMNNSNKIEFIKDKQ